MRVMATYRYRYTGKDPVHMPTIGASVKHGDEVESEHAIHHPDFERVQDEPKEEKEDTAKKHR
jgi:hypothetical protein